MTDYRAMARAERGDLAAFLATLTPDQWDGPTLCTQWRVRDVVAHMFSFDELSPIGLVTRFVSGGLKPDRVNALGVRAYADRTPEQMLALVNDNLDPHGLTAGFGGRIGLTDAMIHHQDIRRPLGQPRDIPVDRLRATLDFARTAPPIGAAKRIRGLTLTATDIDWTTGSGPLVEGPGEALLLAIAGRPVVLPELSGPGVATLAERSPAALHS